jgi:tripartite ATP-independent transporter DctM subunit
MNSVPVPSLNVPGTAGPDRARSRGIGRTLEELLLAAALAVTMALPLAAILMRSLFHRSLGNPATVVQHLVLFVGMAGSALAARDSRLLALATGHWLRGAWVARGRWFNHAVAGAVAVALGVAGWQFAKAEGEAGQMLVPGLPLWVVLGVLPLGFTVLAARLLYAAADGWRGRSLAALAALGALAALAWLPVPASSLVWPAFAVLLLATLLGAPIFALLGGAGLILFHGADLPIASVSVEHYRLTVNPALPAIPLFTLAGYFMAEGGASRRLVQLFEALFGWFRGGPAIAVTLICALFTAFTGGSGVTILALAGLLMPVLTSANYSERDALGLLTGASSLGILLPPCLPVILYAIVAKVDITEMFLGGFLPILLLITMTAAWGVWAGRKSGAQRRPFSAGAARQALWAAKWELLLPVVSLAAIFSGLATLVEAAAVTAVYAFIIEVWIHRDLSLTRDCPRVMAEAGQLVGGILLILGVALGLTNYLIDAQVPDLLAEWAAIHVQSRWLFLLGLNVALILVGGLVEIYAAIVVIAPLLVPIGVRLGIHPVHLGVIFLANMQLGFLAPPVGLDLLLTSSRLQKPMSEVIRAVLPLLLVMFIGVLLITYFPWLTMVLLH